MTAALVFLKATWKWWALAVLAAVLVAAGVQLKKTYWDAPRNEAARLREANVALGQERDRLDGELTAANGRIGELARINDENQKTFDARLAQARAATDIANRERLAAQARADRYSRLREDIANAPPASDGPVPDVLLDALGGLRDRP